MLNTVSGRVTGRQNSSSPLSQFKRSRYRKRRDGELIKSGKTVLRGEWPSFLSGFRPHLAAEHSTDTLLIEQ